jgi:hypothetical protein
LNFVWVAQFRAGLVHRETIYFGEPFPAPEWRTPWAEEGTEPEARADLPTNVRSGSSAGN